MFGGAPEGAPAFIVWGAGGIELVTGALIAIGLFTAPAAFLASGTMAVAYFIGHVVPNGGNLLPIVNKGELAVVYCWLFLYMAAKGAGIWSVDGARSGG
jgi:putative oxidoreductase